MHHLCSLRETLARAGEAGLLGAAVLGAHDVRVYVGDFRVVVAWHGDDVKINKYFSG